MSIDRYGVDGHWRYAYLCQRCAYTWGAATHISDATCPCCGAHLARRIRPVARLTRRQTRRWAQLRARTGVAVVERRRG